LNKASANRRTRGGARRGGRNCPRDARWESKLSGKEVSAAGGFLKSTATHAAKRSHNRGRSGKKKRGSPEVGRGLLGAEKPQTENYAGVVRDEQRRGGQHEKRGGTKPKQKLVPRHNSRTEINLLEAPEEKRRGSLRLAGPPRVLWASAHHSRGEKISPKSSGRISSKRVFET